MTDSSKLQTILDRIAAGEQLDQNEFQVLVSAARSQQVTIATGDRAVAIGGSADRAVIVTGDRNIVISKELAQALQEKIQGAGSFEQQIGDRQTTINYNIFMPSGDAIAIQTQQGQQVSALLPQLPWGLVQRAYRDVLPADANPSRTRTTNPDEMVANLQDFRRLPDFVAQILADESHPLSIWEKLAETIGLATISKPVATAAALMQSHLLITVRQDTVFDQFVVNGSLIPDDTAGADCQRFQALDIDDSKKGASCSLDEIPQMVDKLVGLSLEHLKGRRYDLTIELFLPLDYLHEAVDIWKITDLDDEVPIGTKYRVLVRTSDRLTPKYLRARLNDWYSNWDRVQTSWDQLSNPEDFEQLNDCCGCNWKRLESNLTQKLGLKLTCGLLEEHRQGLLKAVHRSATPIALWSRCALPHLNQMSEMDSLISSSPLAGLLEAIKQKRRTAELEDQPEMHLGTHLAILWENPHRLTPEASAQLTTPGQ